MWPTVETQITLRTTSICNSIHRLVGTEVQVGKTMKYSHVSFARIRLHAANKGLVQVRLDEKKSAANLNSSFVPGWKFFD